MVAGTAIAAVAAGPLIVVVLVTVGVSIALGWAAEQLQIKERITAALDAAYEWNVAKAKAIKKAAENKAVDITSNVLALMIETAAERMKNSLRRAIRRQLGDFRWLQF